MIGTVHTFTVIHVGAAGGSTESYAVVVVDTEGGRRTARAEGNLGWLAIGAAASLEEPPVGPLVATARPVDERSTLDPV